MTLTSRSGGGGLTSALTAGESTGRRYAQIGDLPLESGQVLPGVQMAYQTWGRLNPAGDNAVLVLHALTGDSHVVGPAGPDQPTPGWWEGLIGPDAPLDDRRWYVVAANVLGGCRGTTGPSTPAPDGRPWGSRFPHLTVRDQVTAEAALAEQLGIHSFAAVVGGSMGGMRALEWALMYPAKVRRSIAIATTPTFSADQIAWCVPQVAAIRADAHFRGGDYYDGPAPLAGMAIARQLAHTTYRSRLELNERFGRTMQDGDPVTGGRYAVASYLEHHGDKLGRRFDPNSYLVLTEAMMSHDIGRGRGDVDAALATIKAQLAVAVVDSDRLFPPDEGAVLATAPTALPLTTIQSERGHDGFLTEIDQVGAVIRHSLATPAPGER